MHVYMHVGQACMWDKMNCNTEKENVCVWAWQTALLLCSGVNRIISSHTLPPFHRLPEDRWYVCVWVCVFRPWLTWIMYFLISVSVNKTGVSLPYEPHALENKNRSITIVLVCACAQVWLCFMKMTCETWQKWTCEDFEEVLIQRLLNALSLPTSTGLCERLS